MINVAKILIWLKIMHVTYINSRIFAFNSLKTEMFSAKR